MNYSSQYCILDINLILIVNLHSITIISKDNPIIHGKLFFVALLMLLCSLISLLTSTESLFAQNSVLFRVLTVVTVPFCCN